MSMPQVLLVEDDQHLSLSLQRMLIQAGHQVLCHVNAESLLLSLESGQDLYTDDAVVLMDVNLEGQSGVQAQQAVRATGLNLPFVFMSAQQDALNVNQAWRDGASDFLFKPFTTDELLAAIDSAWRHGGSTAAALKQVTANARARLERLTERQREVLVMVAQGQSNTRIAEVMQISARTVKMHRAAIMHRLGFTHVSDLIRFHDACKPLL